MCDTIAELVVRWFFYDFVGSLIEWLQCRAYDQHGLGSKPTRAVLLGLWEKHFTAFSPACGLGK